MDLKRKQQLDLKSNRKVKQKGNEYSYQYYQNFDITENDKYQRMLYLINNPQDTSEGEKLEYHEEFNKYWSYSINGLTINLHDKGYIQIKDDNINLTTFENKIPEQIVYESFMKM